jgi:DNA modification methylase
MKLPDKKYQIIYADPPYNIRIDYGTNYQDNKDFENYIE